MTDPSVGRRPRVIHRETILAPLTTLGVIAVLLVGTVGPSRATHAGAAPNVISPVPIAAVPAQPFPGQVAAGTDQVISVVAASLHSRTATVRLWQRATDGSWFQVGTDMSGFVGAGGLTTKPSDAHPQTPIGSWALDVVVARDRHITRMPEHVLRPGDGWSSCVSCPDYDRLSDTDELWAGRDSWARIAIHIVTNPKRVPGKSSGVFVHVGTGRPSLGCVGLPLAAMVMIAKWLQPTSRPLAVIALALG